MRILHEVLDEMISVIPFSDTEFSTENKMIMEELDDVILDTQFIENSDGIFTSIKGNATLYDFFDIERLEDEEITEEDFNAFLSEQKTGSKSVDFSYACVCGQKVEGSVSHELFLLFGSSEVTSTCACGKATVLNLVTK